MRMKTPLQLAADLERMAVNEDAEDADFFRWCARGLRQAAAEHAAQFRRAEAALREVATLRTRLAELQSERTQLQADCRALEAVSGQVRPSATEQIIDTDDRGNIRRVTTRPLDESRRPVGFS